MGADRKEARKQARKALGRILTNIVKRFVMHYWVSLAGVAVVAASGFHGVFRSALSVMAIGILVRWFLPVHLAVRAAQPAQMELSPAELADFMSKLGQPDAHQDAAPEGVAKTSPYL